MAEPDCAGSPCTITEYRVLEAKATSWPGTTDRGEEKKGEVKKEFKQYKDYQDAFVAGVKAYWRDKDSCQPTTETEDGDLKVGCFCEKDENQKETDWSPNAPDVRMFKQRYYQTEAGYSKFYLHGTYKVQWRQFKGVCMPDPDYEISGTVMLALLDEGEPIILTTQPPIG